MTTVQISIRGRGAPDDSPLVDDLIEQIRDFFSMAEGVAASIAGDARPRFVWRVVGLSKNSPATLTAEAFPLPGYTDAGALAQQSTHFTAAGIRELQHTGTRPRYFTDNVLDAAERFAKRVGQQVAETIITPGDEQPAVLAFAGAIQAVQNIQAVRASDVVHPYKELGTLEGVIQNVGTDGWGRPMVTIKHRISGADVRCTLSGNAQKALEQEPVANVVWMRRRVEAFGVLRYKNLGKISSAEITDLRFFGPASDLPGIDELLDPHFTGGLSSQDYLARLRNGDA